MKKNKLIGITLAGAILVGGASMTFAGTYNDEKISADEIMPISAPINEEVSTISVKTRFADIQNHWAVNEIAAMESKNFWEDLTGEFEPNKIITATEFHLYLNKLFNFTENLDFEFISEQKITRIEVAKALEKSFAAEKLSVMMTLIFPVYEDTADLQSEENSALSFVFNTGIMKGRTAGSFSPHDPITKAEFAVVLNRTLAVLEIAEPFEDQVEKTDNNNG